MALYGAHNSVEAGVDTIEHGHYIADVSVLKTIDFVMKDGAVYRRP